MGKGRGLVRCNHTLPTWFAVLVRRGVNVPPGFFVSFVRSSQVQRPLRARRRRRPPEFFALIRSRDPSESVESPVAAPPRGAFLFEQPIGPASDRGCPARRPAAIRSIVSTTWSIASLSFASRLDKSYPRAEAIRIAPAILTARASCATRAETSSLTCSEGLAKPSVMRCSRS